MEPKAPRGDAGRGDLERAIAELAERLPLPIADLARVVYNFRWTWIPSASSLFRDLDPLRWKRSDCNPRWVVEAQPPHRLRQLAAAPGYVRRVERVAAELAADLARPSAFPAISEPHPVAYFCSEIGAHCSLPLYGGGLGVLAGDLLKCASDLALPMVGVSLFYRQGYFHQRLDGAGRQVEYWTAIEPDRLPAVLVHDGAGRPVTVSLMMRGRTVNVQIWRMDFGRVPVFFLDTDRHDNDPIDRWITARLYVSDRETRLAQYAVLGCGGVRALRALGIAPGLVHLNEGHAALGSLERIREYVVEGASFDDSLAKVREETVFTTHTPVAAGNEWFLREEVEPVLGTFRQRLGIPPETFYALGRMRLANGLEEPVALTPLALRTSRTANGVSRRHGEVAREMWRDIWPGRKASEVPIGSVTNGVHVGSWMAEPMQELLDRFLPSDWRTRGTDASVWEAVDGIPDAEIWEVRQALRERLVQEIRERSVLQRLARGDAPDFIQAAARIFDPETLTIGFARRVATYKRLYLLTLQLERGLRLVADPDRPVQVVIAGKAHPADEEAKDTLQRVFRLRGAPHVASRIVFLEDYDLHLAPKIVAGVDVWLNLPRPPLEASGTSGMKVAMNGGLNLSVLDGWWAEAYDGEVGWAIDSPPLEPRQQDERDASALYDLLEREVIPLFYERNPDSIPEAWIARIKTSIRRLVPRFSAERMLREYVETVYAPKSLSTRTGPGPGA